MGERKTGMIEERNANILMRTNETNYTNYTNHLYYSFH